MTQIVNNILDNAKVAYKESILIENEIIEDKLLSIIGDAKVLLTELEKATNKIEPKIKDKSQIELDEINKIMKKVPLWLKRPHQKNYKILVSFMELSNNNEYPIDISSLEKASEINDNKIFSSHYSQMKIISQKSHGKIFVEENSQVKLWEPIAKFIVTKFQNTIQEAIKRSLKDTNIPMSLKEILNHIEKNQYYSFGAKIPQAAVSPELTKLFNKEEVTRIKNENDNYIYQLNI